MQLSAGYRTAHGFPSMMPVDGPGRPPATTEEYAVEQSVYQPRKTMRYLIPILERHGARTVVDVGCGVGAMVETLLTTGYDAYGIDLLEAEPLWARAGERRPRDRFIVVDPERLQMPFPNNSMDFLFSFGVIEHVGTADGHSARQANYRATRCAWLAELIRVLRVGGHALLGGPNRNFPIDVAHAPDCGANAVERKLFQLTGVSIHRVWGEHFLWGYGDMAAYAAGLPCRIRPWSLRGFLDFSRVPRPLKPLAHAWVDYMPRALLGTGLNPWMMALITKTGK
jgi:SAM-dependent methyltransferase